MEISFRINCGPRTNNNILTNGRRNLVRAATGRRRRRRVLFINIDKLITATPLITVETDVIFR